MSLSACSHDLLAAVESLQLDIATKLTAARMSLAAARSAAREAERGDTPLADALEVEERVKRAVARVDSLDEVAQHLIAMHTIGNEVDSIVFGLNL